MSRDQSKHRRNEHSLRNLPTGVLSKARSTLSSISGALKPKHENQQRSKSNKQEIKDRKNQERLKNSRSEPEFKEICKKHRSRLESGVGHEFAGGTRPRPLSVGGSRQQYANDYENFRCGSLPRDASPLHQRHVDSTEGVYVQSRLVLPAADRLSNQDQPQDVFERPRKKLSFREPEIVISNEQGATATLGRSNKLMGVNSLTKRQNKTSLRPDTYSSSLEGIDSDLESQAMRIVRTVGQAFEVCHKMQVNSPDQPAPSTSSAVDDPPASASDLAASKEAVSDCGASEVAASSTTKAIIEEGAVGGRDEPVRPTHLEMLPPPPRKEGKRSTQRQIPTPNLNLPDLPECVTKVEVTIEASPDANTPLSAQHQLQLLRERLDQQTQQTRAAVAQLLLLRDQLAAEQAARCEAQTRTHQLLIHNKELLEHIAALVSHLQERERGSSKPINAQQLTLLPQKHNRAAKQTNKTETLGASNGNLAASSEALIDLFAQTNHFNQNVENNNASLSPFAASPTPEQINGAASAPTFGGLSNEEIQNYLISQYQEVGANNQPQKKTSFNANQQFYQNSNAFPNIPPLSNHYSNADIASLLNHNVFNEPCSSVDNLAEATQAMSLGHSENSLASNNSPDSSSKDSSPDGSSSDEAPFIKPLSHKGTLSTTGQDGRVRLIVPVSPSESSSDVPETPKQQAQTSGNTLKVPAPDRLVAPNAPITRSTSEKVPNRSEMMTALRSQWTRHTTK